MFRLVGYDEKESQNSDRNYLCKVAGQTVAEGLRFVYDPSLGDDHLEITLMAYFPQHFFEGFAPFVGMEDDMQAGIELVKRKVERMIQKMENPENEYTFDVFEEVLFVVAIAYVRGDMDFTKKAKLGVHYPFLEKERENEVAAELVEKFGYKIRRAKSMARKVVRFHEMQLKENEDENLFFWDWDYDLFFSKTFVDGIHMLESYAGETSGYGYDYTCGIFTDIGMKAPLLLVGTREANRIANEETQKKVMESLDQMLANVMPPKGRTVEPDEDDELPFS